MRGRLHWDEHRNSSSVLRVLATLKFTQRSKAPLSAPIECGRPMGVQLLCMLYRFVVCNVIIMVLLGSLTFSITKAGDRADCTVLCCKFTFSASNSGDGV